MNPRTIASFAVLAMAALAAVAIAGPSEASSDVGYDEERYCYSDSPDFSYEHDTDVDVSWRVWMESSGEPVGFETTGPRSITVDLSGIYGDIVVEQTVSRDGDVIDTQTMLVHPMHVLDDEDGKFTIRFWDSGNLLAYQEIDETTIVEEGFNFYELPANPTKDGLSFMGWYLDPDSPDGMADPGEPVTDDLDLYARWGGGTGGGTSTVVVHETHVVTFEAVNGLRYDVVSVGEDSVTFMVTPSEGFEFDLSSIRVESTSGMITSGNGIYVLSSIDRDIVVTVTGLQKFTIDYRLEGTSISVPGYDGAPGHTVSGPFSAELVPEEGNELSSVMVLMDGRDVTSEFVHGSFIHIDDVSGNLVIVAEATPDSGIGDGFPWWALVLIVVLILVALLAYARHRSRA